MPFGISWKDIRDFASSKILDQSGSKLKVLLSGTNTYQGSLSPAIVAYAEPMSFYIKPSNTNTGPATLNLNSLGAKSIKLNGADLIGNELIAGQYNIVIYDAVAECFQLQGVASVGSNKLNTGDNAGLSGEEGGVPIVSAGGKILRSVYMKFINATRELQIGITGFTGKLTVISNIFKLQVQDNIGDGQASVVFNSNQDKALQFQDKAGNTYMSFRTTTNNQGVVISKVWVFDQGVFTPMYRAQASLTSGGAGVKVYALKADGLPFSIDMATDTLVCALHFKFKIQDAAGSKIIHARWDGTLKRIGGVISIAGTPDLKTLSDNGTSGFLFGVEAKSDNSGLLLYFTSGSSDNTIYTGSFYDINYSF